MVNKWLAKGKMEGLLKGFHERYWYDYQTFVQKAFKEGTKIEMKPYF